MFGLGHYELLILLAILLILFGHRLPGLMKNLGKSVNSFKEGIHEHGADDEIIDEDKA
jgi:sec-independent protein translocase protein TatA